MSDFHRYRNMLLKCRLLQTNMRMKNFFNVILEFCSIHKNANFPPCNLRETSIPTDLSLYNTRFRGSSPRPGDVTARGFSLSVLERVMAERDRLV